MWQASTIAKRCARSQCCISAKPGRACRVGRPQQALAFVDDGTALRSVCCAGQEVCAHNAKGGVRVTWLCSTVTRACAILQASQRCDAYCCSAAQSHPPLTGPALVLCRSNHTEFWRNFCCASSVYTPLKGLTLMQTMEVWTDCLLRKHSPQTSHRSSTCVLHGQATGFGRSPAAQISISSPQRSHRTLVLCRGNQTGSGRSPAAQAPEAGPSSCQNSCGQPNPLHGQAAHRHRRERVRH